MARADRVGLTFEGLAIPPVDHLSNKGTLNVLLDRTLWGPETRCSVLTCAPRVPSGYGSSLDAVFFDLVSAGAVSARPDRLVVNERYLRQILTIYLHHVNDARPHRTLAQLAPAQAETQPPPVINLTDHQMRRRPILGGLTNEYQIAARSHRAP